MRQPAIDPQPYLDRAREVAELDSLSAMGGLPPVADLSDEREERAAIAEEGRSYLPELATITRYAIEALQQPDTAWGRHAVAKAWLRDYAPDTRIFRVVTE